MTTVLEHLASFLAVAWVVVAPWVSAGLTGFALWVAYVIAWSVTQ